MESPKRNRRRPGSVPKMRCAHRQYEFPSKSFVQNLYSAGRLASPGWHVLGARQAAVFECLAAPEARFPDRVASPRSHSTGGHAADKDSACRSAACDGISSSCMLGPLPWSPPRHCPPAVGSQTRRVNKFSAAPRERVGAACWTLVPVSTRCSHPRQGTRARFRRGSSRCGAVASSGAADGCFRSLMRQHGRKSYPLGPRK
eukprot:scaffold293_cov267-Prasinococcus_capsulatus_cf.AAC.6